ncbi:MAG: cupin domain-containing protein [Dehalococcoidia bacterium]
MTNVFSVQEMLTRLLEARESYHEFLRPDSMSVGIYHLAAGEPDRQRPHTEDEIYYVMAGTGVIDIDGVRTAVEPGSVVYVDRHVPHRFEDYPDGLTLLVVFAPARGSMAS